MTSTSARQIWGEILLTVGVILLLFAFYEAFWTNIAAGKKQAEANEDLTARWHNPRKMLHPELGEAFARLYIPSFGSDYQFAVLEGVEEDDLLRGPGHYPDSQMPEDPGNFAIAGHRVGKGAPFNDLGRLQTCDAIVVETQSEWITYRVLPFDGAAPDCFSPEQQEAIAGAYSGAPGLHITTPADVSVLDPVPGSAAPATERIVTFTTCHPQFSNAERMIVHAMAVDSAPKDQPPAVLEER